MDTWIGDLAREAAKRVGQTKNPSQRMDPVLAYLMGYADALKAQQEIQKVIEEYRAAHA